MAEAVDPFGRDGADARFQLEAEELPRDNSPLPNANDTTVDTIVIHTGSARPAGQRGATSDPDNSSVQM